MKTFLLGLVAFVLAIPTWGISLIVFFWLKHQYDKQGAIAILNACMKSNPDAGVFIPLQGINNGAIRKLAITYGEDDFSFAVGAFSGTIAHPLLGKAYVHGIDSGRGLYVSCVDNLYLATKVEEFFCSNELKQQLQSGKIIDSFERFNATVRPQY